MLSFGCPPLGGVRPLRCVSSSASPSSSSPQGAPSSQPGAANSEPKWKQKLAAADALQQKSRALTAQAQEEYRRRQLATALAPPPSADASPHPGTQQQSSASSGVDVPPLSSLPLIAVLTGEGVVANDFVDPAAKAAVYGVYDQDQVLQYVGVSRQVYQSIRLHFARMPSSCFFLKLHQIRKPSRNSLEVIKATWIKQNGSVPAGNDEGPNQNRWENPLDCSQLMTDAERATVAEAAPGPPRAKALKQVARRVEAELEAVFKQRGCTEVLRFDPKLKEQCLLDLKNVGTKPDTSVPS